VENGGAYDGIDIEEGPNVPKFPRRAVPKTVPMMRYIEPTEHIQSTT
jgi:hypothetical protein